MLLVLMLIKVRQENHKTQEKYWKGNTHYALVCQLYLCEYIISIILYLMEHGVKEYVQFFIKILDILEPEFVDLYQFVDSY